MPLSDPADFIGLELREEFSANAVKKIVDDEKSDRAVYCARVEPGSYERGAEFHEHAASAYELYVICTRSGKVLDVNQRVQHCPCGSRSFAPHGAPVHIFPADAMFDLAWGDVAPSAQRHFLGILDDITAAPRSTPGPGPQRTATSSSLGRKFPKPAKRHSQRKRKTHAENEPKPSRPAKRTAKARSRPTRM